MTRKKNKANRPWLNSKGKHRKKDNRTDDRDKQDNLEKENALFEAYYAAQEIVDESEWAECIKYLRKTLPITFRFSGSRATVEPLNAIVKNSYVPKLRNVRVPVDNEEEEEETKPPEQLSWYPNGLGWQFNVSKRNLRRIPEFKEFHQFLIYETDVGNVSRQEAVSMIPPLFLEVKPGDTVLDMCAAPGSKTAQLLEALHAPIDDGSPSPGPGILIANDSDMKRAHLLIHQSARISSDKIMVTNLDASRYPWLYLNKKEKLRFRKILCDVPCSGDGTLRKNLGIWKKWNVGDGNGLHSLQLRILQRGMAMLSHSAGSRIVYSTCSMNPVENEAVIAAALNSVPGFELEDVRSLIPSLIVREGLKSWSPQPSSWYDAESPAKPWRTWEEYCKSHEAESKSQMGSKQQLKDKLSESMFPPKNIDSLCIDRCLRFLPHLMNTGGFFVAVLRRIEAPPNAERASEKAGIGEQVNYIARKRALSPVPGTESETKRVKTSSDNKEDTEAPNELMEVDAPKIDTPENAEEGTGGKFNEPPFTFLPPDHPQMLSIRQSIDLSPEFPYDHLFVRAERPKGKSIEDLNVRVFYLANSIAKSLITNNDFIRMRLLHAGAKVFARQDKGEVQFRILDEGLETTLPHLKADKIVHGEFEDLKPLLREQYPFFNKFREGYFRSAIEAHAPGSVFGQFSSSSNDQADAQHPLTMTLWKSQVSISLMINKKLKTALSLRLFGEDLTQSTEKQNLPNVDVDLEVTEKATSENRSADEE